MRNTQIKGILLAGGTGSRMRPLTDFVCKQLLPIYNKPLIYYPLTSLILSGIQHILIISTPKDVSILKSVLGNGDFLGIAIEYAVQKEPNGIVDGLIIAKDFIGCSPVCMILGDNIIYKANFFDFINKAFEQNEGASIFGFPVQDPERFGVIKMDLKK